MSRSVYMSRSERKAASRRRKLTENVQINSSTSDWSLGLEGKRLHMNMIDKCPFESLIKLRDDPESLEIMEKAATLFFSNDFPVRVFRGTIRQLELSARSIPRPPESEDQCTSDNEDSAMELSSILPQGEKRRVRFDDTISSCDTETKESTDSDSMMASAPASDVSDDSDDTTWSFGSELDGPFDNEALTSTLRVQFLGILSQILDTTCSLQLNALQRSRIVENGSSRFSSENDGRYFFHLPDHVFGGAEVFGTEDKRRSTAKTDRHKDKLQIQVAGEMLATVFHRDILRARYPYRREILEACPNLQAQQTEASRTVYYLVFTHLSLRIAKAIFDDEYLNRVLRGSLPEHLKVDIMWSHRLRLNHDEDLRKAARLVMCLMLNFRDEYVSGKHYWRPYEVRDGASLRYFD